MNEYTPFKGIPVPTEITLNGRVYVDKEELMGLIRREKRKFMEGTETGYIEPKKKRRIAAMMSLNRLGAILERERAGEELRRRMDAAAERRKAEETTITAKS